VTLKLSCADYTWPALPHAAALDLVTALGFSAVDIGLFAGQSHVRPEEIEEDNAGWAGRIGERCQSRGLAVADVFAQPPNFETLAVNHPDPREQVQSVEFFRRCVDFAKRVGSPGITILPGLIFDDEPWEEAASRAAEQLRCRVEIADSVGLAVSVEPHTGSVIDTPGRAAALVERTPGLWLTVDYGHFTVTGTTDDEIEALLPYARHVQCRGGAPGLLQAGMAANTIDFVRMVRGLRSCGYSGYLACEYVWSAWNHCNEVDNLTETAALRDLLLTAADGAAAA
jgi:sugar phosphate isomerase/epimerase